MMREKMTANENCKPHANFNKPFTCFRCENENSSLEKKQSIHELYIPTISYWYFEFILDINAIETDSSTSSSSSHLIQSKLIKSVLTSPLDYAPEYVKKFILSNCDSEEHDGLMEKEMREIYATYLLKGIQESIKYPFQVNSQSIVTEYIAASQKNVSPKMIGRVAQSFEDAKLNALRSRHISAVSITFPISISDGEICLLLLRELKVSRFGYVYEGYINAPTDPSFKIVVMY